MPAGFDPFDPSSPFDPNEWAAHYHATCDESARNSLLDSGWSKATADRCERKLLSLYTRLFAELRKVELQPSDFFDRPALAAVLAAVSVPKPAHYV